jgi:hypothetical protein
MAADKGNDILQLRYSEISETLKVSYSGIENIGIIFILAMINYILQYNALISFLFSGFSHAAYVKPCNSDILTFTLSLSLSLSLSLNFLLRTSLLSLFINPSVYDCSHSQRFSLSSYLYL